MASRTIKVLRQDAPGNSLALWVAAHHPDLFVTLWKQAKAAETARKVQLHGLRGLGQDAGTTTSFDAPDPSLETITVDTGSLVPATFLTDSTETGSSLLSSIGGGLTSAGSSIADVVGSAGSGLWSGTLSALGSVGSFLTSKTGLQAITGLTQSYFGAQAANSNAQTQLAVLQAQTARVAAGQAVAPIRFTTNAAGQLLPVYATQTPQGAVYQPLSSQGIASLTPSSVSIFLNQYGLWLGLGALALWGFSMLRR